MYVAVILTCAITVILLLVCAVTAKWLQAGLLIAALGLTACQIAVLRRYALGRGSNLRQ
jgi:hypothetical protein